MAGPLTADVKAGAPDAASTVKSNAPEATVPAWKKWYTWVVGGALLAVIIAVVVADHVGSDQLTISVRH